VGVEQTKTVRGHDRCKIDALAHSAKLPRFVTRTWPT